jgi:tetratricopeptide (TPR) repeat protein
LAEVRDPSDPDHRRASVHAAWARAGLGLACFHAGDYARAQREFSRALSGEPGMPKLRYCRARVFERSGLLAEAVDDLEQALVDHPGDVEAHLLLAVCFGQLGEGKRASAALDRALDLSISLPAGGPPARVPGSGTLEGGRRAPTPAHHTPAGLPGAALRRPPTDHLAAAIAALSQSVAERPSFADLRCRLAALLLAAGKPAAALDQLAAALAINPRYLEARLLAARACLERGDVAAAAGHAGSLLDEHPDYPDLHFWLGLARFRARDFAGAAAALERAVALHRQFARAHRLLGLSYHALGRHEQALRCLRRGLMRDRELPQTGLGPGLPPLAHLDGPTAEPDLARALALQPGYPDLHLSLARARRQRGDRDGAAAAYRAALALDPGLGAAALELAGVELARGRPAAAEPLLDELARRHPDWPDAHALLGRTRLARGDAAGAEPALRAALRLNPELGAARADLGWALLAQARARDADVEFALALELDPIRALPRRQLAWRDRLLAGQPGVA